MKIVSSLHHVSATNLVRCIPTNLVEYIKKNTQKNKIKHIWYTTQMCCQNCEGSASPAQPKETHGLKRGRNSHKLWMEKIKKLVFFVLFLLLFQTQITLSSSFQHSQAWWMEWNVGIPHHKHTNSWNDWNLTQNSRLHKRPNTHIVEQGKW